MGRFDMELIPFRSPVQRLLLVLDLQPGLDLDLNLGLDLGDGTGHDPDDYIRRACPGGRRGHPERRILEVVADVNNC